MQTTDVCARGAVAGRQGVLAPSRQRLQVDADATAPLKR